MTGGNRGIGFEICRGLLDAGYIVAVGSRDESAGASAVAQLLKGSHDRRAFSVRLDVTEHATIRGSVAHVHARYGRLDVLVNNAAVDLDEGESGLAVTPATVRQTLDTNVIGALSMCQEVVPGMRKGGYGRIVNVSSGYGASDDMDSPGTLAYKLSKLSLNGMTRILAAELARTGVLVNAMCPGWVRTRMGGRGAPRSPKHGADTAIYLATLPDNGPTGLFFRDRREIPW